MSPDRRRPPPSHAPKHTRDSAASPPRSARGGRPLQAMEPLPSYGRLLHWIGWGTALGLLATCLAITFGPHTIGDYFTETDFYGDYARGAALIRSGHLIPSRYQVVGPGYELALAASGLLVRDLFLAAQLLSAVSAAATLLLWFFLLERRLGPLIAAAGTLLYAANPTFLQYGYSATTDAFGIALQALAWFLLLGRPGNGVALAAGLAAAAAFLTRYTAIYLLPVGLLAIARDASFRDRRSRAALLFGLGFAIPTAAWWWFAASHGGAPGSQLFHMIAYESFARSRGLTWDEYQRDLQPGFHGLWGVVRHDPGAIVARLLRNAWEHAMLDARLLLGTSVALSAAAGILLGWRDGSLRRAWIFCLAGAAAYLALIPAPYGERYSLMLLPVYAMLAGIAFGSRTLAIPIGPRPGFWLKPLLLLLPLGLSIAASARHQSHSLAQLPREVLVCGQALRESRREGDRVIARKPHIAYAGQVESVPFPFVGSLPELGAYARRTGARWLFVSHPEVGSRPDLYPLLDTTGVIAGLTPRCVTTQAPAVLYEIGPEFGPETGWVSDPLLMNLRIARARLLMVPNDIEAMWLEAAMEVRLGDWTRGRQTLERAAALDARSLRAAEALAQRDTASAIAELDRLLSSVTR